MTDHQRQIMLLLEKLEALLKKQEDFSSEINDLRTEILSLQAEAQQPPVIEEHKVDLPPEEAPAPAATMVEEQPVEQPKPGFARDTRNKVLGGVCAGIAAYFGINVLVVRLFWILLSVFFCIGVLVYLLLWAVIPARVIDLKVAQKATEATPGIPESPASTPGPVKHSDSTEIKTGNKGQVDLEKYIGENLISKIGIAILIIGVAIGAKYSIDNDLISPLVRIILGYIVGLSLLGISIKLKKNYLNFSAILVSGAMTIMYFITFAAYSFYALFPLVFAFILMLLLTVATVVIALNYNRQLIAHIGLVGAYSVPFLLSETRGDVSILFSYMAIINCGILFIAFKKYWKPLNVVSFGITWLVFLSWYAFSYQSNEDFWLAVIFSALFFVIFYLTFLAYKIFKKEDFKMLDVFLLLANSFVFYGIGYSVIDATVDGHAYLGGYTLLNAVLHLLVSLLIYKQKLADKNIFFFVTGLVLVFLTLAIPVQLDGNWVTLLWVAEATLLFWIGRTKNTPRYEKIGYVLMLLAFFSITQDWSQTLNYNDINATSKGFTPILNIDFLSALIFAALFAYINLLHYSTKHNSPWVGRKEIMNLVSYGVSGILLVVVFATFGIEISLYFDHLYADSMTNAAIEDGSYSGTLYNSDLKYFKIVWLINYLLLFVSALSFVNILKFKCRSLNYVSIALNILALFSFLTLGLLALSELRESYLSQELSSYYEIGGFHIGIRYISYVFVAVVLTACYKYIKQGFLNSSSSLVFDIGLHISIAWIISSELINWLDLSGSLDSYKLGLTILWGVYALALIVLGIWKKKKHLRVGAIILFSVTLAKLFFYDISHLSTLSKTIVLVALGVLLLIVSFLYNKFKDAISGEN
ncbi:DUF2339 domain-containing protein [Muriicola sp. Z0-33]|uniref:DUF2339 domain-containing protein n=1 Tax=Muriicola sp. Z0-33 TaxID=2816957 RepID=UPI0022386E52|nr:DUF2339 domain-containing protein [Muriicola sp. Z0-33]MCW5514748.1 DUF2339 domain-containing protein [Muriicola sp. Z0-33]